VTISGTVRAGNLKPGVRIWIFAGNYVNVTTTPVNPDGTYTKTFPSAGLPVATYYVVVQSPGNNGLFTINPDVTSSAGRVVNVRSGAVIFTFTGTGSVQDAAASQALSDAINQQGEDDVSARLTFPLIAPDNAPGVTPSVQESDASAPGATPTAKSPLPPLVPWLALVIGGIGAAVFPRSR
jgi:hypothetical protein